MHIRAIATVVGHDGNAINRIDANSARQLQQIGGVFHRQPLEGHRLEQAGHARLLEPRRQIVGGAPLHIGAVATALGEHGETVDLTDRDIALWLRQQGERHLNSEFVGREVFGNAGGVFATLHVRAVLARLHHNLYAIGIVTKWERVDGRGINLVEVLDNQPLEARQLHIGFVTEIEPLQPVVLALFVASNRVEVFFDTRSERVIDQTTEVLLHQSNNCKRCPRWDKGLALLPHIATVLHGLDDAGPCAGTADAKFFEALHDAGLGVTSRRRRAVTVGRNRLDRHRLTNGKNRQQRFLFFVGS